MATTSEQPTAVGVFDDIEKAERTLDELRRAGFQSDEIGIIGHVDDGTVPTPPNVKAPEDNTIGGLLRGALCGAIVGTLVIVVLPGIGEVTFGRWFEILGGALLGAIAGGILIAFSGLFMSRPQARFIANQLESGRFVVTVKNPARKEEAVSVLRRQGIFADQTPGG